MDNNGSLNWSGKNLKSLNEEFVDKPSSVYHFDISMNQLKTGKDLGKFENMRTLVLDNNFLYTLNDVPKLANLDTLSANKN
jgi:hypothetical protein